MSLPANVVFVHRRPLELCEILVDQGEISALSEEYDTSRLRRLNNIEFSTQRHYDRVRSTARWGSTEPFAEAAQYELAREWLDAQIDTHRSLVYWTVDCDASAGSGKYAGSERVTIAVEPPPPCAGTCHCSATCTPGDSLFAYLVSPTPGEIVSCVLSDSLPAIEVDTAALRDDVRSACLTANQLDLMKTRYPEFAANADSGIIVRDSAPCSLEWFLRYVEVQSESVVLDTAVKAVTIDTLLPRWSIGGGLPKVWNPQRYDRLEHDLGVLVPGTSLAALAADVPNDYRFAREAILAAQGSPTLRLSEEHQAGVRHLARNAAIVSDLMRRCEDLDIDCELRP